jgi:C4-dicarboxylate-specific signal transduction histidine kinase
MIATSGRSHFWRISDWRIGFKLPFFFLVLTVIPLVLIGLFVINLSRGALLDQGIATLQSASHSTAQRVDDELTKQRDLIAIVAQMPEIARYVQNGSDASARDGALKVLRALAAQSTVYESIALIDRNGSIILSSAATEVGTDVRFRPYFQEAIKGATYISDPSVSIVTGLPAIFYAAPVKAESGTVIAIVRSQLSINEIWSLVEQDDGVAGPGSYGMLLDENGLRLAHSSSKGNRQTVQDTLLYRAVAPIPANIETTLVAEKRLGSSTATEVQTLLLPDVASRLTNLGVSIFETGADTNSSRNQAVMVKLQSKAWRYLVAAPLSTFTAPADRATLLIAILSIVVGGIAVFIALMISRSITRPLVTLAQIAYRISVGEVNAKITVSGKDEVGELADAFKRMQTSIETAIERLRARRAA